MDERLAELEQCQNEYKEHLDGIDRRMEDQMARSHQEVITQISSLLKSQSSDQKKTSKG